MASLATRTVATLAAFMLSAASISAIVTVPPAAASATTRHPVA